MIKMVPVIRLLNNKNTINLAYYNNNNFSSSKPIVTTSYPYAFGGLKNVQFKQNQTAYLTLKQIFSQDTVEGFKDAYRYIFHSLAQKDLKNLENICEPTLTKNLNLMNVNLINPDASIQVLCGRSFKAFGMTFTRDSTTQLKQMQEDQQNIFYLNLGLMNPNNPTSVMKYMSGGLPILLGYQVLFKSAMKLVPEGGSRNQRVQEVHAVQFEVQGKINIMKYMKMAMSMSGGGKPNVNFDQAKSIIKQMVGENYEWKVGDIDRALKGNLKIVN